MNQVANAWLEHQRLRWTRLNAHQWRQHRADRSSQFDRSIWHGRSFYDALYDRKTNAAAASASRDEQLLAVIRRAQCQVAAARVEIALKKLAHLWRKAGFNPNQPRVPRGNPDGGQWTDDSRWAGGSDSTIRLASSENRPPPPGMVLRIAAELAVHLIRDYRRKNNLTDLLGKDLGTVAYTRINDKPVFGVNSDIADYSTAYTDKDEAATKELRSTMLQKYPDKMNLKNIGGKPNDALFHAEAHVLLQAAQENGGTLKGQSLTVFVDGPMCNSCRKLLPSIGLELGNPFVRFVDKKGKIRIMHNGRMDPE